MKLRGMFRLPVVVNAMCAVTLLSLPARAVAAEGSHAHLRGMAVPASSASRFDNLGPWHRTISTASPQAQRYFDQGMRLLWGFNLEESQRSFEAAVALDSTCASCWWGLAMSLGPHINLGGIPQRTVPAAHAATHAASLMTGASEVERALITASSARYSDPPPATAAGQFALDSAYAAAMRDVAARYPLDDDAQALCVEALMDLHPWDYWNADGTPQPWTPEIVSRLESILARDPLHPGANHYFIHAVEASPHPEQALASADRLREMMPGAGHMVHMPSHIYQRVGRYEDAVTANRKAVAADQAYEKQTAAPDFYRMYMSHTSHFLSWTYMVQGRSSDAVRAARAAAAQIPPEMARAMPGMDFFIAEPVFALARFGRWGDLIREPAPPAGLPFLRGTWHYGRGLGFAGLGRLKEAARALDSLTAIRNATPAEAMEDINPARGLLSIAVNVLAGEIRLRSGKKAEAVGSFQAAVAGEDSTRYSEAADWLYPTRHHLGKALLAAGQAPAAEAVYREDLKRNPENGWALVGLAQSLRLQGKLIESAEAEARFKRAWSRADVVITASAY